MDRLNPLHHQARVELPASLTTPPLPGRSDALVLRPTTRRVAGILGFFCCSAAVIATASMIALQVH